MKYSCFTVDSIRLMAEAACIPQPSTPVAATISEDVTYRLRLILSRANKFMQHSKRTKLACADINRALRWADCQPVFGHECNPNQRLRYSYSTEAQVFVYENNKIDLVERYRDQPKADDIISEELEQEATPWLKIEEVN